MRRRGVGWGRLVGCGRFLVSDGGCLPHRATRWMPTFENMEHRAAHFKITIGEWRIMRGRHEYIKRVLMDMPDGKLYRLIIDLIKYVHDWWFIFFKYALDP